MVFEKTAQDFVNNVDGFVDYLASECRGLQQLVNKVTSTKIELIDGAKTLNDLEDIVAKEKAKVDYGILLLSKRFTELCHDLRTKLFKSLDNQLFACQKNHNYLKENILNQTPKTLPNFNLNDFSAQALKELVNKTPQNDQINALSKKLDELVLIKRATTAVFKDQNNKLKLIKKFQTAGEKIQTRVEKTLNDLSTAVETALTQAFKGIDIKPTQTFEKRLVPAEHFQINVKDSFKAEVTPFLHYFEPETRVLHFVDVSNPNEPKWTATTLDIPFNIPAYHSSVATPCGKIFLMGGLDQNGEINKRTYEYDPVTRGLYRKANMHLARDGLASCYVNGKIYVVGGVGEKGTSLTDCEVYDIKTNTWSVIQNTITPTSHASLVRYQDSHIYKIGGYVKLGEISNTIEVYSIAQNTWGSVVASFDNFKFMFPLCAAVQLNRNEIFVFGGNTLNHSGVNTSYILNVHEKVDAQFKKSYTEYIDSLNEKPIPVADGFWDSQVVVSKGRIFALQNVTTNEGTIKDKKTLLTFDGKEWKAYKN